MLTPLRGSHRIASHRIASHRVAAAQVAGAEQLAPDAFSLVLAVMFRVTRR
jgi:hypothetical protein